jgi:hypothetical protein
MRDAREPGSGFARSGVADRRQRAQRRTAGNLIAVALLIAHPAIKIRRTKRYPLYRLASDIQE